MQGTFANIVLPDEMGVGVEEKAHSAGYDGLH
jgi:hypothetical protein